MSMLEKRYAEALMEVSIEQSALDAFRKEFSCIVDCFNSNRDFMKYLLNPEVNKRIKEETIDKIFEGRIRPELSNFLKLLVENGRISFLPGILEEFENLANKKKNVLDISIESYEPLDQEQLEEVKEKYRKMYKADSVVARVEVGKDIFGGIKVRIGDQVVDSSVKGRLEELKKLIMG